MNCNKQQAIEIIDRLHQENSIDYRDYCGIHDGLDEIEPLRDRDEILEELWEGFADIPLNPETECIEAPFMLWGPGTHREEIWRWFDERHSKGIVYLLYHNPAGKAQTKTLMLWKNDFIRERDWDVLCDALGIKKKNTEIERRCVVCAYREYSRGEVKTAIFECESTSCCYNHSGECRFALVHERKPHISNADGCVDYEWIKDCEMGGSGTIQEHHSIDYWERLAEKGSKRNMTDFIDAFIGLAHGVPHNDSDIIEMLLNLFTREELEEYGFGDFIRSYFEDIEDGETPEAGADPEISLERRMTCGSDSSKITGADL